MGILTNKGQGLVEFALIAPILIFFLLGVFEVGWAIRGYLILINATREAARFAAKPGYLVNPMATYEHMQTSLSNQIDFKGPLLITVIQVEDYCTGVSTVTTTLQWAYPYTPESRIDWPETYETLRQAEHQSSCDKASYQWNIQPHQSVFVEAWYEQPQLFGFPLISNPFTDPIPMYEEATFRVGMERK